MHVVNHPFHEGVDEPFSRIFGVGGNTCNAAHIHDVVVNIYLHGINDDHGSQLFLVKPSEHIGLFQNGTFGVFDFLLLPAGLQEFIGCDLECLLEQGIELFQITFVQLPHSVISVNFQICVVLFFVFHKSLVCCLGFIILSDGQPLCDQRTGKRASIYLFYINKNQPSMGFSQKTS